MSIKVEFPVGKDTVSVRGLYQWDYGQVLEIESADIGSEVVEVHFACTNMSEAIVRPCSFSNGVGTVTIPDQCLEQATPVTAWVYSVVGTQGRTIKTITLNVTARTRPSVNREIPPEFSDKYTELITEINEAINKLESGDVTAMSAKNAENATNAGYATTAGNASGATYAISAGSADRATTADFLVRNDAVDGAVSSFTVSGNANFAKVVDCSERLSPGVYFVSINYNDVFTSTCCGVVLEVREDKPTISSSCHVTVTGGAHSTSVLISLACSPTDDHHLTIIGKDMDNYLGEGVASVSFSIDATKII